MKRLIAVLAVAVAAALGTVVVTGAPAQAGCVYHDLKC